MSKLHVFVDGSWLFKACAPGAVLSSGMENPSYPVVLDFEELNNELLSHVQQVDKDCTELGDRVLATAVLEIPADFDTWPSVHKDFTDDNVRKTRAGSFAREQFVTYALEGGYSDQAVYRPQLKPWVLRNLINKTYQEKQVDATLVALLVKSAIVNPGDYHCVVTGDVDMLPAIQVAYPEYSKNVFIGTTYPDELKAEHRQASYSLGNFEFEIPTFYIKDHLEAIVQGKYAFTCAHCHKVFVRENDIPKGVRPCCNPCHRSKT